VATVSIDKVPTEGDTHIPLMGVSAGNDGGKNFMGLSYETGKKWKVLCGGGQNKEPSSRSKDTTHHVVILLRNGNQGSAYIDGQRVGGGEACKLENTDSEEISHFYIGGDGKGTENTGGQEGVSVTVTDVLLYNRPLSTAEIGALNPNKVPILPVVPDNGQVTLSQSSSAGPLRAEQESSMMSSGVGGVGVSTSRETTVTNPLPGLESAQQLASVKSSDGTQSVNAASSSVGDKTVGRGAGDETQNDETHQPSMNTSATADANTPTAKGVGHDGSAVDQVMNASFREDEEVAGGTDR
ncbi:trans-sialidase, putative, partial [Trypanosoma cruzi]